MKAWAALTWVALAVGSCTSLEMEEETRAVSSDGVRVYIHEFGGDGDGYPVLLFHQAGSSARGEFAYIADRLIAEGFKVYGADLRSGGDLFGVPNLTAKPGADVAYCDAYPDVLAASRFVLGVTGMRPILVGSSYSAALVMKAGVEHPELAAGFASFSPANGAGLEVCAPSALLDSIRIPGLGIRPRAEIEGPPGVLRQAEEWRARGVPMEVVEVRSHGASVLVPSRAGERAEDFWPRFTEFLQEAARLASNG